MSLLVITKVEEMQAEYGGSVDVWWLKDVHAFTSLNHG